MPYKRNGQWYNNSGELIRSPSRYFQAVDEARQRDWEKESELDAKIADYEAQRTMREVEDQCARDHGFKSAKSERSYEDAMYLFGDMDMWDDSE